MLTDFWNALLAGFGSRAGLWIVLLLCAFLAFSWASWVFVVDLLTQALSAGRAWRTLLKVVGLAVLVAVSALLAYWWPHSLCIRLSGFAVGLLVPVACLLLIGLLIQALGGEQRMLHSLMRFIELHLLGILMMLLGAWCTLTAGFGFIDGPYREWLGNGALGVVSSGLHLLGTLTWLLVAFMALRFAVVLVIRAYRRPSHS